MSKADLVIAHNEGYNRGYAKAKAELENKIADIKVNCDFAIEGRDVKIKELEQQIEQIEKVSDYNADQLTKAKEIIKGLYFIIQSRIDYENDTGIADEMWRAKQFL